MLNEISNDLIQEICSSTIARKLTQGLRENVDKTAKELTIQPTAGPPLIPPHTRFPVLQTVNLVCTSMFANAAMKGLESLHGSLQRLTLTITVVPRHYNKNDILDVSPLVALVKLTSLDLTVLHYHDPMYLKSLLVQNIDSLRFCTKLQSMQLTGNLNFQQQPTLPQPNLKELSLSPSLLTLDISMFYGLRTLHLSNVWMPKGSGGRRVVAEQLSQLKELRGLWLDSVSASSLGDLSALSSLQSLSIKDCQIFDGILEGVTGLRAHIAN